MAAPMRSVLFQVQKTATRLCCSRGYLNPTSTSLQLSQSHKATSAKLNHIQSPSWKALSYNLASSPISSLQTRSYGLLAGSFNVGTYNTGLLQRLAAVEGTALTPQYQPSRTVISFSRNKGKKKTVKAVTDRFYRFDNGLWLRTIAGRNKKQWKKTPQRKRRTNWHVFCSRTQCKKLDLMVTSFWKQRRYYPDDPLEPFQGRNFKGLNFYPGKTLWKR